MKGIKRFSHLLARRRSVMCSQLVKVGCAVERFGGVGKKVSGHKSGNTNAEQKDKKSSNMRLKASSECKAEQVKDCRTKSLKK